MTAEPEAAAPKKGWFNRSVLGFGLASFLSDAGHEAATSAMPALLVALGAPPWALGVIEGVSDGLSSFAKLFGGSLADRPSWRKPLAVAGYFFTGLSTGAFGLATSWLHVLVARSIGWTARGVRGPARDAMLADAVDPDARGRAFGFHRAMDTAGAATGPAIAVALTATIALPPLFAFTVIPGVLAALAFAVLVRPARATEKHTQPPHLISGLRALPGSFRTFLVAVLAFGLGDFARSLLILRATLLLAPSMGHASAVTAAIALYVLHNVVYAGASFPVGWLADRMSPRALLVVGYLLGGVTAIGAALGPTSLPLLAALFVVAGLTLAFVDTLEGTIVASIVGSELRGTAYGVLAATNGVGDLVSSVLVGGVWTWVGPERGFGVGAALCLGGALLLAARRRTAEAG
ncbi:MAG TPA: MFS transporter [Minicystis sp.]|nr:MFS transporter [Minicystis sp.]